MTDGRRHPWARRLVTLACMTAAWSANAEVNVSGSAFVDYWNILANPRPKALTGISPEVALKAEVDIHETLSFSGRLCFGCHGVEVDRAHIDYTPTPAFNVQVGRIGV